LLILVAFFRQSRLLVARVKIDGSFVRDVQTNRRSQATVQAIVQLAKSMGADTVGETVETLEAADKLRQSASIVRKATRLTGRSLSRACWISS
jgi:EAL domain-containing protein (putative c-di-GMP-specific phosphodiesterase class I)